MNEVPVWTCSFEDGPEAKLDSLTVGTKFGLKCHGDIPVEWAQAPVHLAFPKEDDNYTLFVLKTGKLEAQDAEFIVTGYKAGKHQPDYIRVLQGEKGFEVAKPQWEIKSVLKPNEQVQAYPPFGPYKVSLPLWIIAAVVLAVALITFTVWRQVRRATQRRRMLEELKRHRTALSPLHQFYRDARGLRRRLNTVKTAEELKSISEDLNRDFRLYVLRQFEVPALDWTDSEILRDMRKRHRRIYLKASDQLKKTLRELVRLRTQQQILMQDVEQLHRMSLDAAERLEKAREGAAR